MKNDKYHFLFTRRVFRHSKPQNQRLRSIAIVEKATWSQKSRDKWSILKISAVFSQKIIILVYFAKSYISNV